jgi:subtilisin family serine protease
MLPGLDLVKDGKNTEDCYGHGTSVAGIIGGTTFGVAKNVNIIPIRMADCYGTGYNSEIITGIDWIIGQRKASGKPSVINISMGGAISSALELAVNNATKAGIVVVVSAGNDNKDACQSSPANIPDAITVGAISKTDNKSNYSNFGSCVDIFAPGDYIWSADFKSDSDKLDLSGTSLASPFVAGAAALYLSSHPSATPAEVTAALKDNATKNVLKNIGSKSPNLLLFTGFRDMLSPSDLIAQKCTIPSNLIVNGDFERGPTVGWSATKNVIATNSKTKPSLSGLWKAAFNGLGKANSAFLKQTVSIPADACSADLSFSAQVITKDGKSNYMKDFLKIYLTDENGKELSNLTVLSNLTTPNNYIKSNVNLLAHKGKTIVINFYGVEDKTLATTFMVDDVSLNVIQ